MRLGSAGQHLPTATNALWSALEQDQPLCILQTTILLGSDVTASNFASVQSKQIEDLAAAILTLVAETVGIISSICAREAGCGDKIVVVGKVAQNQFIRHILNLVGKLYQTTFIFPDKPGFATVYGAAMKYQYDLLNPDKKTFNSVSA
jgi:tRNA A37 threonylcarbamoyltransferase TsaD